MTQDEIIRMAREAGLWPGVTDVFPKELERFAALVAAHEREACANLRDKFFNETDDAESDWNQAIDRYAAAIRNRGEK